VKFAAALQKYKTPGGNVDVTAISQSSKKREDALKMGATSYLDMSDKDAVAAATRTFDLLICTADGVNESLPAWIGLVTMDGTFLMVGAPNGPMQIHPFSLMAARCKIDSSGIGSIAEIHEMLAFAAEHDIKPIIEKLPMEKANEGLRKVRDGAVRFRVVLENPQQKK
jgi:D-arabinose 1-dehydrogenase-like Zn-dependent alcohol dehydrogenase